MQIDQEPGGPDEDYWCVLPVQAMVILMDDVSTRPFVMAAW
jgi:hypothetical protein